MADNNTIASVTIIWIKVKNWNFRRQNGSHVQFQQPNGDDFIHKNVDVRKIEFLH